MSDSFAEAISGAAGGAFSSFMVYPLERIKTNLQVVEEDANGNTVKKKKTMVEVVKKIIREEGYLGMMKGVELGALQSAIQKFVYFYIYGALLRYYREYINPTVGFWSNVFIGYVSDLAHQPITLPIETIGVRVQTGTKGEGILTIARNAIADGSCYNGLTAYFFLCLSPAFRSTIYDTLKALYMKRVRVTAITGFTGLVLGMFARTIASSIMYPFIRGRVILQGSSKANVSLFEALMKIINEQGILSLYSGLDAELLRGIWSTGLMYMAKESVEGSVKRLIRRG